MPGGDPGRRDGPAFSLERFGWGAPDRLELSGTFSGIEAMALEEPVLAVHGEDGPHRLPAISGDLDRPADGVAWTAAFAWLQAPVPFDRARLELGAGLAVDLPAPGEAAAGPLPLLRAGGAAVTNGAADVEARLREGLATVRASAEEALGAVAEARVRAEEQSRAEVDALRRRIAELEPAAAELEATRSELDRVRGELDTSQSALADAHAGAQALLDRLGPAAARR